MKSKVDLVVPKRYYLFNTHTHTHIKSVCTNTLLWISEDFPIFRYVYAHTCCLRDV